jgi:hypothetical protein
VEIFAKEESPSPLQPEAEGLSVETSLGYLMRPYLRKQTARKEDEEEEEEEDRNLLVHLLVWPIFQC